jgi:flagellar basal-body rod protein FlgC
MLQEVSRMQNILSIGLSGMDAAARRLEASASNIANINARGSLPSRETPAGVPQPYQPVRVEQASAGGGGTIASMRSVTPAYLAVYDPGASFADGNGMVAAPNVDLIQEMLTQVEASAAFTLNVRTVEAANAMVKTLYDLAE